MEEKKIKAVTVKKIYEILDCHHTKFYKDYFPRLKPFSFFDVRCKNRRLYPLDKVMELKAEIDTDVDDEEEGKTIRE